jgi:hypothetical protein
LKTPRTLPNWAVLLVPTISALVDSRTSPVGTQQTIVTSSTRVVVVVIPGFPAESMLLGFLVGLGVVLLIRLRRAVNGTQMCD